MRVREGDVDEGEGEGGVIVMRVGKGDDDKWERGDGDEGDDDKWERGDGDEGDDDESD